MRSEKGMGRNQKEDLIILLYKNLLKSYIKPPKG
jgi:hypothetical protein